MGVETELLGLKNRYDGKEFRVIEREDGTIAVLAGDRVLVDSGVVPVTAIPSSGGVTNWDVSALSIAGHVVYSALPKLNGHLPADGRTYSISAYPTLARRLGRISNGLGAFSAKTGIVDYAWYSVCWSAELSLFVAVAYTGTGNRVMTSPDGITWTARTSAADNAWRAVCWSPELSLFVAVADSGTGNRVMTAYGCTYNPITDFAVPKITAPAGCYAHIFAG